MNELERTFALSLRRFCRYILGLRDKFDIPSTNWDCSGQAASDLIRSGLESKSPFAVSRFGYGELRTLLTYIQMHDGGSDWSKIHSFAKGDRVESWWHANTIKGITHNAGLFPKEIAVIEKFCELILGDIGEIDVLGSWLGGESLIRNKMAAAKFIRFHDFYHFLHERPWTAALKGMRVLVVHPFSKSIQNQYKLKDRIFSGPHVLPEFTLITYTAIQSIAGNIPAGFRDWFEALDFMKSEISRIDFDVAILGCGAYGMPLAAFIKRDLKRKAVHLGGNVQILFGIKGSRWEKDSTFSQLFNSYWVKPLPEETPSGHNTIDDNCYW